MTQNTRIAVCAVPGTRRPINSTVTAIVRSVPLIFDDDRIASARQDARVGKSNGEVGRHFNDNTSQDRYFPKGKEVAVSFEQEDDDSEVDEDERDDENVV